MSIIKGTNKIVAGFGGTKENIGDVKWSYSKLATDNSGRLPLFTGETIASANTIYPEFYNWLLAHPELVTTLNLYNQSIEQYGECPKYLIGDDTSNTVGWPFEKNKIVYTTNTNLTITIGSYNSSEGFSEAENYNLLYSNTPNISDSYVQVYIDEELTKPAYLKYVVTGGNTTTTTYRALFIKLFNSKITLYYSYNNAFSIVYDHTDTTVTANVPLQLDIDSYIPLSLEPGSIRLPKYLRSHGTVIKEKKPTDTDPTWYRQWSDGWLEQGGTIDTVNKTITFLKPFADTNYTLIGPGFYIANAGNQSVTKTTAGFTTTSIANLTAAMYWEAKGQGADGAQEETLYPWVVAYTSAIPASMAQAAEFQQGLSGKADSNLGNLSAVGKDFASGLGMPSNRYIDLTLGASGSTYTAPANGYFQLAVLDGIMIQFYNKSKSEFWKALTASGGAFAETIECQKGDIIQCYYSYTTFRWFRFYYAEGAK